MTKPAICPDCGLTQPISKNGPQEKAPLVCAACLKSSVPIPPDGWPLVSKWVSADRGRGVMARRDIVLGETIERCWVMPLPVEETKLSLTMPVLNRYLFPWLDGQRCIISGEGLLYNLDAVEMTGREPNIVCVLRQGISCIEFRALRNIRAGEELTWNYHRAQVRNR